MLRTRHVALVALLVGSASACAEPGDLPQESGPPPRASVVYRSSPELDRESSEAVVVLWDATGRPLRVRGAFASEEVDLELAARSFLERHASLFRLRHDSAELELRATRRGLAGSYLRFGQVTPPAGASQASLPVLDAEVVVLVSDDAESFVVREVTLSQRVALKLTVPAADIGPDAALELARDLVGRPLEELGPEVLRAVGGDPARVVYRVRLAAIEPTAAPEVVVDAATGDVLVSRDRMLLATGNGLVFDPNPVATTANYALADNNNATSPTLDAARYAVSLEHLDGSGFLRGSWVDSRTQNVNQRAQSAVLTFNYTRAQLGFEQTMAYYHLDRVQTRLQTLGFTDANARQQLAVVNGLSQDNSQYSPATLRIDYGTGGVDDAEDADVIVHEYGHAIQNDQVPGWGGADEGSMGEGFGDYLAASVAAELSSQIDDPHCLAEWDATSYASGTPACLRRTDVTAHYPEGEAFEIHDDGQMWATALFALDQTLGADVMNRVVVESHFSLSTSATFFVASQALLDADAFVFAGAHEAPIRRRLIQQGLCRITSAPSALVNVLTSVAVSIDNPRSGANYVNDLDDTQTFTYPGAQALRVHFTTIDTENDSACVDGGCDNLYLTGVDGDLYQFFHGQQANVLSVAIPGDTVHFRLVSDYSVGRPGYHVDRVDILGDPLGGGGAGGTGGSGVGAGGSGATGAGGSGATGAGGSGATGAGGTGGSGATGAGGSGATGAGGMGGSGATGAGGSGGAGAGGSGATGAGGVGAGGTAGIGGTGATAGSGGDAGAANKAPSAADDPSSDSSCGCRVVGAPVGSSAGWLMGAIGLVVASRRRRGRRSTPA